MNITITIAITASSSLKTIPSAPTSFFHGQILITIILRWVTTGLPSLKFKMLSSYEDRNYSGLLLKAIAWMAIWSPSRIGIMKLQTSGAMTPPSIKTGSKADTQTVKVGTRFKKALVLITSSKYPEYAHLRVPQTFSRWHFAISTTISRAGGLKSSIAISWHTTLVHQKLDQRRYGTS